MALGPSVRGKRTAAAFGFGFLILIAIAMLIAAIEGTAPFWPLWFGPVAGIAWLYRWNKKLGGVKKKWNEETEKWEITAVEKIPDGVSMQGKKQKFKDTRKYDTEGDKL